MLTVSSTQLLALIASFAWPFMRILGLVLVAPLLGNVAVPVNIRVVLTASLALVVAPSLTGLPPMDPLSLQGIFILTQQFIIGAAMGFVIRLVFAAVELAGEVTGMTMGLGFASFYDPQSQGHTTAISQFLALVVLMMYLATNMHLLLLATLVESFTTIPVADLASTGALAGKVAGWASYAFSGGLQLAMPMVGVLLITNIALGILTRAAPQLNIFGIGFPVTISVGLLMLALVLPYLSVPVDTLFGQAFALLRKPG